MSDKIFIRKLLVPALIGILPDERKAPQNLSIDLELSVDFSDAAKGDDLSKTIDYSVVRRTMIEFIAQSSYELLETLADRLASHLHDHFNIVSLRLCVTKQPFDIPDAEGVGVIVERVATRT